MGPCRHTGLVISQRREGTVVIRLGFGVCYVISWSVIY